MVTKHTFLTVSENNRQGLIFCLYEIRGKQTLTYELHAPVRIALHRLVQLVAWQVPCTDRYVSISNAIANLSKLVRKYF